MYFVQKAGAERVVLGQRDKRWESYPCYTYSGPWTSWLVHEEGGLWRRWRSVGWETQREVSEGHRTAARFLESFRPHDLRFVDADRVAAITVGYIRCDLGLADVGALPPPTGAPVFYANAIDQAAGRVGPYGNRLYGGMFGRARWRQE